MNYKKPFLNLVFAAAVLTAAISIFNGDVQLVRAQSDLPPPVPERTSFGMVGITSGQTLRVSVANTIMPSDINLPPGPSRIVISFRYLNGNVVRDSRTNEIIRKTVDVERGDGTFIDLEYDQLPPGPIRAQIRPVVFAIPPPTNDSGQNPYPRDAIVPTVEVFNNVNGRSQVAVFTHPAVVRGFNPQPDPPAEP